MTNIKDLKSIVNQFTLRILIERKEKENGLKINPLFEAIFGYRDVTLVSHYMSVCSNSQKFRYVIINFSCNEHLKRSARDDDDGVDSTTSYAKQVSVIEGLTF